MRGSTATNHGGDASLLTGSLRTLFDVGTLSGLTDGQLLERFRLGRGGTAADAEVAFTVLVERHGPMVLHICRAVLGDRHDAEDACQAVFLVLARRAGSIRRGDSVASWLYGVARRIAARARRDLARREPTDARVAWTGTNESTEMNRGLRVRLFDRAWTNPHPEKEIATLDVLSAGKRPDPFLVAVTLERP